MKIAVCSHMSLFITAFTTSVSQLCANDELAGGWSESAKCGVTHVTAGSSFASMSCTNRSTEFAACSFHRSVWKTPSIPL